MRVPREVLAGGDASGADFRRHYLSLRTPIVFSNLFEGMPVKGIRTEEQARTAIGGMTVKTRSNYLDHLFGADEGREPENVPVLEHPLTEFLDSFRQKNGPTRLCVEYETPVELRRLFEWPKFVTGVSPADTPLSLLFVANAGSVAHMHFDTDHRHVLLYQVFGRKRVIMIRPRYAKQLMPLSATSLLAIARWPEPHKQRLFEYVDAFETVLEPGDGVYIPPLWWHYVEYLDAGMSFSIRFGRNDYSRFIAGNVFPDLFVQNVGEQYCLEPRSAELTDAFDDIVAIAGASHPSFSAKYSAIRAVFEELYNETCPDALQPPYCAAASQEKAEHSLGVQYYENLEKVSPGMTSEDSWRTTDGSAGKRLEVREGASDPS